MADKYKVDLEDKNGIQYFPRTSADMVEIHNERLQGTVEDVLMEMTENIERVKDAQKNSDITKAEIEAKLTGEITSHTHPSIGGGSVIKVSLFDLLTSAQTESIKCDIPDTGDVEYITAANAETLFLDLNVDGKVRFEIELPLDYVDKIMGVNISVPCITTYFEFVRTDTEKLIFTLNVFWIKTEGLNASQSLWSKNVSLVVLQ